MNPQGRSPQLIVERRCAGVRPHYFEDGVLWATRGNRLVRSDDLGRSFTAVAQLVEGRKRFMARLRSVDRFTHVSPFVVVPTPDGAMAFSGSGTSLWRRGTDRFTPMDGPVDFRPLRRGVCPTPNGRVYVGEYRMNGGEHRTRPRDPVHIWCWDGAGWSVVWRFPEDTVRHVHAILPDSSGPDSFFVCTGDTDEESVIWRTSDGFATLTPWLSDGQTSRACDLVFTNDAVLWGIDSPLKTSGICRLNAGDTAPTRLRDVPGPVYYGGRNEAGHMWFGTSVEDGPSVTTNRVHLFASTDGGQAFHDAFSRRADSSPQLSVILFPRGVAPGDAVVFSLRATWRWEGQMVVGRLAG